FLLLGTKTMTPSEVTQLRLRMRANGYDPIPVMGKRALLENWPSKVNISEAEILTWETEHPDWSNTGLLTARMPTIDSDIRDPGAAEAVERLARDHFDERGKILVRIGEAPKRAILCRTQQPFRKRRSDFLAPNGQAHHIEILGVGQQIVGAGEH